MNYKVYLILACMCLAGCHEPPKDIEKVDIPHYAWGVSRDQLQSIIVHGRVFGPTKGPIYTGEEFKLYFTQDDADAIKQKALDLPQEELEIVVRHYLRMAHTKGYMKRMDESQDVGCTPQAPLLSEIQ